MKSKRKLPKTFISFLIISFLIWVLIAFSKEYDTTIKFPVSYQNISQNKLLQEEPIQKIDINIKATGFKILRSQLSSSKIKLEASNLKKKENSIYYFILKNQSIKIEKQLISGVKIIEILQDTIFLNIGVLSSKKVALKPNLNINYHIGYDLLEDIKIEPDSVIISGTENQLKKINFLNLKKITLKDVKSNFEKTVEIIKPNNLENLKINNTIAKVIGKIEKFTEGKLKIPFSIKNLPNNLNVTTLTENVEVSFVVALSNFAKVSTASFKVECDYNLSQKNNLSYLIPKVTLMPKFLKSYKVIPFKIDFLIQK